MSSVTTPLVSPNFFFFFWSSIFCESTFPEYVQYFFLPEDVQLWQPFDTMAFVSLLSFLSLSIIPSRENGRGTKKIFQVNSSQAHFETHEQLIMTTFFCLQPQRGYQSCNTVQMSRETLFCYLTQWNRRTVLQVDEFAVLNKDKNYCLAI